MTGWGGIADTSPSMCENKSARGWRPVCLQQSWKLQRPRHNGRAMCVLIKAFHYTTCVSCTRNGAIFCKKKKKSRQDTNRICAEKVVHRFHCSWSLRLSSDRLIAFCQVIEQFNIVSNHTIICGVGHQRAIVASRGSFESWAAASAPSKLNHIFDTDYGKIWSGDKPFSPQRESENKRRNPPSLRLTFIASGLHKYDWLHQ